MSRARTLRNWAMSLAYINAVVNLLVGSSMLAAIWLLVGLIWTGVAVHARRRRLATSPISSASLNYSTARSLARPVMMLQPGERVIPILQLRKRTCSHWPRDSVQLSDGTTVAYICRRCDHDWADESYLSGVTS